ncbi:MAG: GDP-mannose 4,6-dehydratase [Polyangiaceae bacterium]
MTRVVVVGANGQDGRILFERRSQSCAVLGLDVEFSVQHGVGDVAPTRGVDLQDPHQVSDLLGRLVPDELYYLAAHHHSSEEQSDEATEFRKCSEVHLVGLVHVLEAIRRHAPNCRVFFAGSSQMFGEPAAPRQNESTPFAPRNAYAITKVAGAHACALYRERHGVYASVGILYNHESPSRGPRFVTQRIARGAWQAKRDPSYKLRLGSLSGVVDWGYAPDYVDAMIRIVAQPAGDDYVIATGEPHTVRDFVEVAFRIVGVDWKAHVEETPSLVRATRATLIGDSSKLRERTGWKPTLKFEQLVEVLVRAAE